MKAYVFTDPALSSEAGRFVWLAINTELAENAPVRKQLGVRALPTYYVLNPHTEQILARRVGAANLAQFREFLVGARALFTGQGLSPSDLAVARAESLSAVGETDGALLAYQEALRMAPEDWNAYGRTAETLLFSLQVAGRTEDAARLARTLYPKLKNDPAALNVALTGLDSAVGLPADHPQREEFLAFHLEAAHEVIANESLDVPADDLSSVYGTLAWAYRTEGDSTRAREATEAWAAFLEEEAGKAKNPDARAVYDSHRLSAYLRLGEPERAVPMLQASERDLPEDYNPPARLAVAYLRMGDLDEALAANDRALALVYGPRRIRVLSNRADIYEAREEVEAARAALEEALALAEALPDGQRSEATIARLRRSLEGS